MKLIFLSLVTLAISFSTHAQRILMGESQKISVEDQYLEGTLRTKTISLGSESNHFSFDDIDNIILIRNSKTPNRSYIFYRAWQGTSYNTCNSRSVKPVWDLNRECYHSSCDDYSWHQRETCDSYADRENYKTYRIRIDFINPRPLVEGEKESFILGRGLSLIPGLDLKSYSVQSRKKATHFILTNK